MNWTFIPANRCLIYVWFMMVDLFSCKCLNFVRSMNWLIATIVWISSGEPNVWSLDSNWNFPFEPLFLSTWSNIPANLFDRSMNWHFLLNFWTDIPAECIWSMTWTVIPERTVEFSSMIWTDCLTFDRSLNWFSISCGNFGLIWLLTCTVTPERTFDFCNPVTFVWLRNERFPAYVFRDSCCFEHSVQLYTYLRSRIWTIYFRNLVFVRVSELPSGVSDLHSRWNLSYLLCLRTCFRINLVCFRLNFAAEFELCASDAFTSFLFRHRTSELISWFCFARARVLNARAFSEKEQ